ncbi:hypothetical protein DFH06DRAFT_1187978 [Mycena polygramma]|nr:hypothetical protein DFH06DRAFT_1187978 [Mycena polygramma]
MDLSVLWNFVDRLGLQIGSAPLFYLHRVRTFDASSSDELPSPELFESLSSSCPREHLFPNLRFLTWTHNQSRSRGLYSCIRAVLGPRLIKLEIRAPRLASDLSILPTIAVKCPNLTEIEIKGENRNAEYQNQFRSTILLLLRGLSHIQKLHIPELALDGPTLEHLATTSNFRSLRLGGFPIAFRLAQPCDGPRFAHLTSLEISSISVEAASDILLCRPPLAKIDIGICPVVSIEGISDLYRTIAENLQPMALWWLSIYNTQLPVGVSPISLAFPPFLIACNLTTLKLRNDYAFVLDDVIVLQMARAWPNLQLLDLISSHRLDPPSVTLAALCIFAEHCPLLLSLAIDINALTIPPLHDFYFMRPVLTGLNVGSAPIEDPSVVADFIFALFPDIALFWSELATEEGRQSSDRWETVKETLAQKRGVSC